MTYTLTKNKFASYNYSYDPNFDILRANISNNDPIYYEEVTDNILLMLNDYDDSIVGFQIINYTNVDKDEIDKFLPRDLVYVFNEIKKKLK